MRWIAFIFAFIIFATVRGAAPAFEVFDIYISPGTDEQLAAYQVKITGSDDVKIVGVEGGVHPAFSEPPFYDSRAIQKNIIILGAFSTKKDLPSGRTRVATIHVQVNSSSAGELEIELMTAANRHGERISPEATIIQRTANTN